MGHVRISPDVGSWKAIGILASGRNCDNHLIDPDQMQDVLKKYRWMSMSILGERVVLRHQRCCRI